MRYRDYVQHFDPSKIQKIPEVILEKELPVEIQAHVITDVLKYGEPYMCVRSDVFQWLNKELWIWVQKEYPSRGHYIYDWCIDGVDSRHFDVRYLDSRIKRYPYNEPRLEDYEEGLSSYEYSDFSEQRVHFMSP
jgi:hypothetical protein